MHRGAVQDRHPAADIAGRHRRAVRGVHPHAAALSQAVVLHRVQPICRQVNENRAIVNER
jgi:hypothetical protein